MTSTTFIASMIIIGVIAIIFFWMKVKNIKEQQIIDLSNSKDKLAEPQYESMVRKKGDRELLEKKEKKKIAAMFLEKHYDIIVSPRYIVYGINLPYHYKKITGKNISILYDMRSVLGINGEITVVKNKKQRDSFPEDETIDFAIVKDLMDKDLDKKIKDYLYKKLAERWMRLTSLNNPNIINNKGSFLYCKDSDIHNIIGETQLNITKYNLLCSDLEFESLITRLSQVVKN